MPQALDFDVLVVGAGAAGMTAALCASARGLKVLLVESTNQVGGTSATSAGTLWIPCASPLDVNDITGCRQAASTYLQACIGADADRAKIDALLESGPELLRFLREQTQVRLEAVRHHPDYLQGLPGATLGGRAFAPDPFDGRRLGRSFSRVRPPLPEFMVLGGMMVSKTDIPILLSALREPRAFLQAARLVARYARDRLARARGTRLVMGNALVAQLLDSLLHSDVEIAFDTRVTQVVRTASGFGCTLSDAQGERQVRTRKAVVLATGGFSGNPAMRQRWLPAVARAYSVAHAGGTGGGIQLGLSLGGTMDGDHMPPAFWMPVSTMKRTDGSVATFPHIVMDRAKPGLLAVDATGNRFANEADSYHHFCEGMLESNRRTGSERFFLITDAAFVERHGLGLAHPGRRSPRRLTRAGYLTRAGSPRQLAQRLQLEPGALERTLTRYNELAAGGVDVDFHRGESALNQHNGDPTSTPNRCLRPLDTRSLCAVEIHVADLGTSVGLRTDSDARVLDAEGRPIPGVYACGNDMASMMRGAYPGPGATLGPGMTFAWRAVRHLSDC
ncbi:FAD-dependent oxidoreductase [Variovorax sp. W2I14]|uniref:FAD-dependent oxidoreductase n=1 Tax=Variovorax sp. W2I14 TaxID=3042290 RepID=UPI003D255190